MNIIHAIILGIVEGITEFLPVSSTGHMILAGQFMGLEQSEFLKSFEIAIQMGAILAVVVLYAGTLLVNIEVVKRIVAAFIPTAIVGALLYKVIKHVLLGNPQIVLWSLFLGGLFLIVFDLRYRETPESVDDIKVMPYRTAVLIGLFQSLAMIPGVSRSAATIIGGLFLGMKRRAIVEFSFLLAVPTMTAATALDLMKSAYVFSSDQFVLLGVGFVVSFIVAIASIKFLLNFIKTNNFVPFGIYRVLIACLFWALVR